MTTSMAGIAFQDFSVLTIASGVVTVTKMLHTIAAESGTADSLTTITAGNSALSSGGVTFRPFLVLKADAGDTITIVHDQADAANIYIPGAANVTLTENNLALFMYDGTNWRLMNSVGQAVSFTVTNWTNDVAMDCNAAADAEIADVLGTLIKALIAGGIIGGSVAGA